MLDPDALTIGFARRFATYKRGTLMFRSPTGSALLLNDDGRCSSSSPARRTRDHGGKELIARSSRSPPPELRRRMVFIEDYDIAVARFLVQGVDVWLNNPRRPHEASGTQRMKSASTAASTCRSSTAGGTSATTTTTAGPSRRRRTSTTSTATTTSRRAIFDLLEHEIVPLFYERWQGPVPRWVQA